MKKPVTLLIALLMLLSLSACSGADQTYRLEDGGCTIELITEMAPNYTWKCSFSEEGIVRQTSSEESNGVDYTGRSSVTTFAFEGVREGTVDVYFSYLQDMENGAYSGITKFYTLTVDEDGNITSCVQMGNTLGSSEKMFAYLKADTDAGYHWKAEEYDSELLTIGRTGAEQDSDKSNPGIHWEVFYFNISDMCETDVTFALYDPDGEVVQRVTYTLRVADTLVTTVRLP